MSTTTMAGTEQSEDLQSLYNAVLQGFANEDPNEQQHRQRTIASPASGRSARPLPTVPRVAQSVYDSIPPPPPMPAKSANRLGMPEPAHGYPAPSTTMTSQNGNGFRRGPSFRPPGAGKCCYFYYILH